MVSRTSAVACRHRPAWSKACPAGSVALASKKSGDRSDEAALCGVLAARGWEAIPGGRLCSRAQLVCSTVLEVCIFAWLGFTAASII